MPKKHSAPASQTPVDLEPAVGAKRLIVILAASALTMLTFVAAICAFKVLDRDFWWHVKAGEIMVKTGRLIATEPFSHTREGMPYLATHEWLAQVVLWAVHAAGGSIGIILFRTAMVGLATAFMLAVDPKRLWPNLFLAIYAVNIARPGFMDRPQLFTFVFVAMAVWMACRYLDAEPAAYGAKWTAAERALWWFVPLTVAWVNAHGAAALVGLFVFGAVAADRLAALALATTTHERRIIGQGLGRIIAVGIVATFGLLVSPTGTGNITYILSLLNDQTVAFIGEWQPRAFPKYAADYTLFWAIGLSALLAVRRRFVFSALVFVTLGYLSMKAVRHEMLFAFGGTGIILYQLRHSPAWRWTVDAAMARTVAISLVSTLFLVPLGAYTALQYRDFASSDHLYGYGTFDLARGAYEYVERNGVQGKMFNTYGIGGYLLYRGHPDRKVFIDGRNVDYGLELMSHAYKAGSDREAWDSLIEKYGITYAIVDYDAIKENGAYPYADVLDTHPDWALVHLDHWVGVYLKRTPENSELIARDEYRHLTPRALTDGLFLASDSGDDAALEAELRRAMTDDADGIKAQVALSKLHRQRGDLDRAREAIDSALLVQPYRTEVWRERGATSAAQERWAEAADAYMRAVRYKKDSSSIDLLGAAEAYEKLGESAKAERYRARAARADARTPMPTLPPAQNDSDDAHAQRLLQELLENSPDLKHMQR